MKTFFDLLVAPLKGLAFIIFLPVAGFALLAVAIFYACAEGFLNAMDYVERKIF